MLAMFIADNDDTDLDRLLEIDEEMQTETTFQKVVDPPQVSISKRTLENLSNQCSRDTAVINEAKRRKSILTETAHHFHEPSTGSVENSLVDLKQATLLKRIPLEGDYVSVTFDQGNRYYLKVNEQDEEVPDTLPSFECTGLAEEAKSLLRIKINNGLQPEGVQYPGHLESNTSVLLTTKYAPTNYLDLISDEATNRTLLRWIKAWDPYVFGTPSPALPQAAGVATSVGTKSSATVTQFSRTEDLEKMAGELDPRDGLPRYRLVLLAGCPGLGKTTLAHLLAEHSGYQVIEINASDERTVTAFKDQLTAIVSSTTSLNSINVGREAVRNAFKPCCLILDEIDGAIPAAVELLANAAKCTLQSRNEHRGRSKRNVSPLILRRPVICICNDLFATSVRPLRAPGVPCLILRLPCVDLGRLTSRLDIIARKEGIPSEKLFLTQLAEMADRDVRACLNAMQFLKSHFAQATSSFATRNVSLDDLTTMIGFAGGLKDVQRSLFEVWKAVFTIPPARVLSGYMQRRSHAKRLTRPTNSRRGRENDSESTLSARLDHLMEIVDSAADAQPVAMGIFENYLNCRMKDSSLNIARQASSWFVYHDLMFRHIHSCADYSMLRYTSHLPAWFHLALATPLGLTNSSNTTKSGSGLHWPTAHTEANTKRQQCLVVLDQLLANQWSAPSSSGTDAHGGIANSFRFLPRRRFLLDVASSTLTLLSLTASSLRPLNAQLYSQQEKVHLANLTNLMLNLGLDFSPQQNTETGEVELRLDPELDQIVCFGNTTHSTLRNTAHTTKQLIARELALERMRRAAHNLHGKQPISSNSSQQPAATHLKDTSKIAQNALIPLPLSSSVQGKLKVKRDFFGRPLSETRNTNSLSNKSKEAAEENSESRKLINQALYYRFREGYSNAVRRPVTMKHFL